MAIPDYQSIMLPLLKFMSDGEEHKFSEMVEQLATAFNLTEEDRKILLPSGQQPTFENRVGWARVYLKKAGLLESKRRGFMNITERGKKVLSENLQRIDVKFLKKYPEFLEFQKPKEGEPKVNITEESSESTPEELLENAYQRLRVGLAKDLLQNLKDCSPAFFERLVIDVLIKMGYGGSRVEAGQAVGRSGDGGIDGIIKEDKLGLDIIYIQAKRWEGNVSRPEIQKFAGALQGQRARKGIFITTSSFSSEAIEYAKNIESKIILIDGQTLAGLMIDHNVGVSPTASYEIKKIDSDYFTED
jgi:restriction system protein